MKISILSLMPSSTTLMMFSLNMILIWSLLEIKSTFNYSIFLCSKENSKALEYGFPSPEPDPMDAPAPEQMNVPEAEPVANPEMEQAAVPEMEPVPNPDMEQAAAPEMEQLVAPEAEEINDNSSDTSSNHSSDAFGTDDMMEFHETFGWSDSSDDDPYTTFYSGIDMNNFPWGQEEANFDYQGYFHMAKEQLYSMVYKEMLDEDNSMMSLSKLLDLVLTNNVYVMPCLKEMIVALSPFFPDTPLEDVLLQGVESEETKQKYILHPKKVRVVFFIMSKAFQIGSACM